MGRAYIPGSDYTEALQSHFDPTAAVENMKQLHEWMKIDAMDLEKRREMKCEEGYDLRVWEAFPGDSPDATNVVLQNLTFGLLGSGGGPTKSSTQLAARLVEEVKN
jgi:hypothetical protein